MSSKQSSYLLMATLIMGSSFTTLASDQNIPQPKQAQKSRDLHSGATSANGPHDQFTKPLTPAEVKAGNVPHMMPPTHQKPNKPIPDAPAGFNKPTPSHPKHNCPTGSQDAWEITKGNETYILLADGTKIVEHPNHGAQSHDVVQEETEDERNLKRNPLLTPAEEELRNELEGKDSKAIGSFYKRPGHGDHEFGKQLNGKVYFKATSGVKGYKPGLWVEDPNVKPQDLKERKPTGIRPKINLLKDKPEPVKKPGPIKPGAVGLTARTNTAQTNPKTGQVEMQQGKANVAQTGLTKEPAPKIDIPATGAPVPPPLPPEKPSKANVAKPTLPGQKVDTPAASAAAAA